MANYGTVQGVQDMLADYADLITGDIITPEMLTRFLVRASNKIDSKVSEIATVPLATVPDVINDIAVDLAVCLVLSRVSIQNNPNYSEWVKTFCEDPLEYLDNLIKNNPGLFDPDTTSEPQMLSDRKDEDRTFTVTRKSDGTTKGKSGTMEDW